MRNLLHISELHRRALLCVANWPDDYDYPEAKKFAEFVAVESLENIEYAVELALEACQYGNKLKYIELLEFIHTRRIQ